jgi:hypothetical protein
MPIEKLRPSFSFDEERIKEFKEDCHQKPLLMAR